MSIVNLLVGTGTLPIEANLTIEVMYYSATACVVKLMTGEKIKVKEPSDKVLRRLMRATDG